MKKFIKSALAISGAIGLATAVYAANYTNQGEDVEGQTFWTLYKYNSISGGVNITDNTKRKATISFENPNSADTDFVGGVGWRDLIYPTTVSYKVTNWTWQTTQAMDNRGVFGVYGWSCALRDGFSDKNVEFYIVDNWLGKNQYVPYYNGSKMIAKETIRANGADYKIYQSGSLNRANACGGSDQTFIQLWAVREGKRSLIKSPGVGIANSVDFKTIGGALGKYGYMTYNMRYLVVGVDVFQAAKGNVSLDYVNKS
jgi:hypothetical protein